MRIRTLHLKREELTPLTGEELAGVNGAQQQLLTHLTCNPTDGCGHGPSFDQSCPTLPVYYCIKIDTYTLRCR